jgi:hypothetical protein
MKNDKNSQGCVAYSAYDVLPTPWGTQMWV